MNCKVCNTQLSKTNTTGYCNKPQCRKQYTKEWHNKNKPQITYFCLTCGKHTKQTKTGYCNNYQCRKTHQQTYYKKPETRKRIRTNWHKNKEHHLKQAKQYREKNKEKINIKRKQYYIKLKKENPNYVKELYWKNPEKNRQKALKWFKLHPDYTRNKNNIRYHTILKHDPLYKISSAIRKDLRLALQQKNLPKHRQTFELLDYTPKQLKEHLEKQFDEKMNWKNYGTQWHIDHCIPLSWAKTKKEIIELNQLKNIQPLEAKQNMSKGNRYAHKQKNDNH